MIAAPTLATEQDAYHYVIAAIRSSACRMFAQRVRWRDLGEDAAVAKLASDALQAVLRSEEAERHRRMKRAALHVVSDLAPMHREVIELLVLRDPPMRLRDVAAIQGSPVSSVYSRLRSALRSVARGLGEELK